MAEYIEREKPNKLREILFRAKATNGEWVFGGVTQYDDGKADIHGKYLYIVDPETVGQFTGLKDKNGVKIFEGDIIQTKYGRFCEVVWRSNSAVNCWDIIPLEHMHRSPDEWDLWDGKNLSVVGNIFDNPELLEGGDK